MKLGKMAPGTGARHKEIGIYATPPPTISLENYPIDSKCAIPELRWYLVKIAWSIRAKTVPANPKSIAVVHRDHRRGD